MARRFVVLAASAAFVIALPGIALAADAHVSQLWNGSRFEGKVEYYANTLGANPFNYDEANDVAISMPSSDRLVIKDRGAYIWSGWGWGQSYGCETANVSDYDGTYPSTCTHPNGIVSFEAYLYYLDDVFAASVPSGVRMEIFAGGGNDHIDVRDGAGGDVVWCGSGVDWVFHDQGDSTSACESESLGGVLTSGVAAASWASGRLDVFARGTDDALYHRWYAGGWSAWERLGGGLTSDPAAVSWGPNRLDVFARGTDNALWHRWYDGRWFDWERLGGTLTSGPAVASRANGRLDVFWRGAAGDLRVMSFDSSTGWSGESSLGGRLTSDPAAVSSRLGRIDVFVRGTDNALYQAVYDFGWQPGFTRIDGQLTSGPAVASQGPDKLDVFVLGTDGNLYRNSYDGGWSGFGSLGGRGELTSDPAAVSWGPGRLDVFARGTKDNALYHMWL